MVLSLYFDEPPAGSYCIDCRLPADHCVLDCLLYRRYLLYHPGPAQITRPKRNESVSTHTIDTFCTILHCRVEDIMEFIEDTDTSPCGS